MRELVDAYIKSHELAWARSTLRSERSRLESLLARSPANPKDLYEKLSSEGLKPYAIKTAFIRMAQFEKWAKLELGYQEFLDTHRRLFKHAYERKTVKLTYEEALARIKSLASVECREAALTLLSCGLRISELYTIKDGQVIGKGGKPRRIYGSIFLGGHGLPAATTLRRALKGVGLSPHDLRKLSATRAASRGASAADLCEIYGWSNITTAFNYLQSGKDTRLSGLLGTEDV